MARRFGQNIFAGISGVVTAAGLAVCLATATGKIEVRKHTSGATASGAAQIQATQYRIRKIPVLVAQSQASAQGYAKANWRASGTVNASATAYGRSKADFYAAGTAEVFGYIGGSPYRLARTRTLPARGTASLEGEAFLYQFLKGKPAVGTATLYGTTYHLAYGTAVVGAAAQGQMVWTTGAKAHAEATVEATGQAVYIVALYGQEAVTESDVRGHEAVTRNGVRYLEAFGEALCDVVMENTFIGVHPSVTAFGTAKAQGRAIYFLGGKGYAQGYCTLHGTMLAAGTAATMIVSNSWSSAIGRIRAWHKFKGKVTVTALGSGIPEVKKTGIQGNGASSATGSGSVIVINTKVYPDTGYGVAHLKGTMNRVRTLAGGPVNIFTQGQAQIQRSHKVDGVALGRGILNGIPYKTTLSSGKAQATVKAQITNTQLGLYPFPVVGVVTLTGQIKRSHFSGGNAVATATSMVGIQVNDAAKAPITRTVLVTEEIRTVEVPGESRTVVV